MPYYNKTRVKWIGQIKFQGKKKTQAFLTKKEAKAWEQQEKTEVKKRNILKTNIILLIEFATEYLDYVDVRYERKTYLEKRLAFKHLFKSISPEIPVDEIHSGQVLKHLRIQFKNRSGNSANKDRKNFIAGWNWAIKYIDGFPRENPFIIDKFPEIRQPRYIPMIEDFWKVYDHAESEQDKLLLLCFLHLAARRSEVFKIKWIDINFKDKKVIIYTRKRQDSTLEFDWLPLTNALYKELIKHKESIPDENEYVFTNSRTQLPYRHREKWMPRICKKAKVKPFGVHSIRHLSASILCDNDVPLIDIKTILRHKNISTTEKYIHRLKSVRRAVEVFEKGPQRRPAGKSQGMLKKAETQ